MGEIHEYPDQRCPAITGLRHQVIDHRNSIAHRRAVHPQGDKTVRGLLLILVGVGGRDDGQVTGIQRGLPPRLAQRHRVAHRNGQEVIVTSRMGQMLPPAEDIHRIAVDGPEADAGNIEEAEAAMLEGLHRVREVQRVPVLVQCIGPRTQPS